METLYGNTYILSLCCHQRANISNTNTDLGHGKKKKPFSLTYHKKAPFSLTYHKKGLVTDVCFSFSLKEWTKFLKNMWSVNEDFMFLKFVI